MVDDERLAVVLGWEYVCGDKVVVSVVEWLWQRQFHQIGQVDPSIRRVITHDDLALTIDKYVGIVSLLFMIVQYVVVRCPSVLLHMVYCK